MRMNATESEVNNVQTNVSVTNH